MKRLVLVAASLAAAFAAAPAAGAERNLPLGRTVEWRPDRDPPDVRYRAGDLRIHLVRAAERDGDEEEEGTTLYGSDVTVESAGRTGVTIEGDRSGLTFPTRLTAGRWNAAGDVYLIVETYTGGAHCCDHVQVAVPTAGRYSVTDIGSFDGERLERLPADLDRDGELDFFVRDDRFLYAFGSYAGSLSPPQILNLRNGGTVDVSDRPAFRNLFAKAARGMRKACLGGRDGIGNEACPAYVAASARAGRFQQAWGEVAAAVARHPPDPRTLPTDCRAPITAEGECPADAEIVYRGYMEALRAFLIRTGYISR